MLRVMNFSLLAKSLCMKVYDVIVEDQRAILLSEVHNIAELIFTFVVMCLERRTHTVPAWSEQFTCNLYCGLLPAHIT